MGLGNECAGYEGWDYGSAAGVGAGKPPFIKGRNREGDAQKREVHEALGHDLHHRDKIGRGSKSQYGKCPPCQKDFTVPADGQHDNGYGTQHAKAKNHRGLAPGGGEGPAPVIADLHRGPEWPEGELKVADDGGGHGGHHEAEAASHVGNLFELAEHDLADDKIQEQIEEEKADGAPEGFVAEDGAAIWREPEGEDGVDEGDGGDAFFGEKGDGDNDGGPDGAFPGEKVFFGKKEKHGAHDEDDGEDIVGAFKPSGDFGVGGVNGPGGDGEPGGKLNRDRKHTIGRPGHGVAVKPVKKGEDEYRGEAVDEYVVKVPSGGVEPVHLIGEEEIDVSEGAVLVAELVAGVVLEGVSVRKVIGYAVPIAQGGVLGYTNPVIPDVGVPEGGNEDAEDEQEEEEVLDEGELEGFCEGAPGWGIGGEVV